MRLGQVIDPQIQMDLLRVPSGQSGCTWFGASWTPTRAWPSTLTMCQSGSASTVPPSTPAQKLLSLARSAASNTTTW